MRQFPAIAALTVLFSASALFVTGCSRACTAPPIRPDIVLVVVDTLRADHLGVYGHSRPASPHMDQLAAEGLWFSRAYAQSGWTLASFSSLFSGTLPHQHCVGRDPLDPTRFGSLPAEVTTLAEAFAEVGYATAAIMNNTFLAPEFGLNQGFGENYLWQGATNDDHRSATESVQLGLDWLQKQETPAFLVVHLMEPHLDHNPPPATRGTFLPAPPFALPLADPLGLIQSGQLPFTDETVAAILAVYDEEILAADQAVGALRAGLAARNRPTYIALTADHGEEFWDHGGFEHGHSLYSELTRVPLILTGPDLPITGRSDHLVQHLDLFQTLLHWGGVARPPGSGGEDLLTLARQPLDPARTIVNENILYGPPQTSLIDGQYRLVVDQASARAEVWRVAPDASDRERLQGDPQTEQARRMLPLLEAQRGGSLRPCKTVSGTHLPDFETFQMLKKLGYID